MAFRKKGYHRLEFHNFPKVFHRLGFHKLVCHRQVYHKMAYHRPKEWGNYSWLMAMGKNSFPKEFHKKE